MVRCCLDLRRCGEYDSFGKWILRRRHRKASDSSRSLVLLEYELDRVEGRFLDELWFLWVVSVSFDETT